MSSEPGDSTPTRLPRVGLAVTSAVHAVAFASAGAVLPWADETAFTGLAGALALAHVALLASTLRGGRALALTWRAVSWLSAGMLAAYGGGWTWAGFYLIALYGGVGQGMAAAALAATSCLVLFTLPMACWGFAQVGSGLRLGRGGKLWGGVGLSLLWGLEVVWTTGHARAVPLTSSPPPQAAELALDLEGTVARAPPPRRGSGRAPADLEPLDCGAALDAARDGEVLPVAIFAHGPHPDGDRGQLAGRCVSVATESLAAGVVAQLAVAGAGGAAKVDVVTTIRPLGHFDLPAILDGLRLRSGLEGLCGGGRCFMPWQLVAMTGFDAWRPIPSLPDLRIGADFADLRARLGVDASTPLFAVETASLLVSEDGRVEAWRRMRGRRRPVDAASLAEASRAAEAFVVGAQWSDGKFRYMLDPARTPEQTHRQNLPRQAGTTAALCAHGGQNAAALAAIRRSLDYMASMRREAGERVFLSNLRRPRRARLGYTALPLAAFLACRPRAGDTHDVLIAELARTVMAMQRPNGSFYSSYDVEAGAPRPGPDVQYASGQSVLGLSLLEALAEREPDGPWPSADSLGRSVERAMDYFSGPYWDHALADFFFAEENWHCLAARASLPHHRHDGYERFCLDYVRYQTRFILDERSRVAPEFRGAHSFSNLITPHNTPSAGYVEALSAAMAVKRVRGEPLADDLERLHQVLGYLLTEQWTADRCFYCAEPNEVVGGFSKTMTTPEMRIDYAQHAWSAIGHGGAELLAGESGGDR